MTEILFARKTDVDGLLAGSATIAGLLTTDFVTGSDVSALYPLARRLANSTTNTVNIATPNQITIERAALTGDVSAPANSNTTTLATVNLNTGTFGSATQVGQFTVNGKGLITGAANVAISITASQVSDFTEAAQDVIGALLVDSARIDYTYNDAGNSFTTDIVTNSIGNTQLRQGIARSVIGVTGNATANVADIQGTADQVLVVNGAGTALAFGTVATGGLTNNAVTYAKIQDISANNRVLGATTAGDPVELTITNVLDMVTSAANGDILIRSGGVWTRLGIGSNTFVLTSNGTVPTWAASASGAGGGEAYVTIGNTAGLSAERALTAGTDISVTDGGANSTVTIASTLSANQKVDHSAVTLTAGNGLTGGGDITASRTFDVGAGTGITANANDIAVNFASAGDQETATSTVVAVNPAVQQRHPSANKAWCDHGIAADINSSYNIASVTDTSVGAAAENFSTAFSSANYTRLIVCQTGAVANIANISGATVPTASACVVKNITTAAVLADPVKWNFNAGGDQ